MRGKCDMSPYNTEFPLSTPQREPPTPSASSRNTPVADDDEIQLCLRGMPFSIPEVVTTDYASRNKGPLAKIDILTEKAVTVIFVATETPYSKITERHSKRKHSRLPLPLVIWSPSSAPESGTGRDLASPEARLCPGSSSECGFRASQVSPRPKLRSGGR
ncbi:hypothetical protein B0H67DRAFT_659422 [Lasiosphaeris hirsuta]|uniref:Uncharacterized protein n=1 Tax=Lasiosphaeris hirsuta TaxID=260670 RepID=A0AA40E7W1_9PEZI|nr:hypothetical protein B0H67DRAFT_659422 [Lasiosphaeris hirsuta]